MHGQQTWHDDQDGFDSRSAKHTLMQSAHAQSLISIVAMALLSSYYRTWRFALDPSVPRDRAASPPKQVRVMLLEMSCFMSAT